MTVRQTHVLTIKEGQEFDLAARSDMLLCSKGCEEGQGFEPGVARQSSHGIVEHHVLLGQLQQHGVVKELADAHILAQTLHDGRQQET